MCVDRVGGRVPSQHRPFAARPSSFEAAADHGKVYALWDALSDFDVAASEQSLDYLLKQMCHWLRAEKAFWIGAVRVMHGASAARDPMAGWRGGALQVLDPAYSAERIRKRGMRSLQAVDSIDPGDTSRTLAAWAGRFRVYSLRSGKLVDLPSFQRTDHYDLNYRQRGLSDRLWVVFPVNADVEAYYCFDKYGKRQAFRDADVDLAAHTLRGIKWFHRPAPAVGPHLR